MPRKFDKELFAEYMAKQVLDRLALRRRGGAA
jgi:hypothetical protein